MWGLGWGLGWGVGGAWEGWQLSQSVHGSVTGIELMLQPTAATIKSELC